MLSDTPRCSSEATAGAGSVAHVLEQRRRARRLAPPVRVELPDDPRVRDLRICPHRMEAYDALGQPDRDDNEDGRDE